MKKMKMSIMKWLGIYERLVQLEVEIAHLQARVDDQEMSIDSLESDMGDKVASWEVQENVEIDLYDYSYTIEEMMDDWSRDNLSGILDERMDIAMERLANEDTIREIVCREIDNHPSLECNDDSTENTTWDMNEIIQEVIEELVNRLK